MKDMGDIQYEEELKDEVMPLGIASQNQNKKRRNFFGSSQFSSSSLSNKDQDSMMSRESSNFSEASVDDQCNEILANVYKANMKINKQFLGANAQNIPSSQKSSLFEDSDEKRMRQQIIQENQNPKYQEEKKLSESQFLIEIENALKEQQQSLKNEKLLRKGKSIRKII